MLNNFLKFERKIYQVFGLQLGRALSVKAVVYFLVIGVVEIAVYNMPMIGNLINWLPFSILLMIPIGLAWLLADVGTEGRSPVHFFRSFFAYQKRKLIDKSTMFRGRKILKPTDYQFRNYVTIRIPDNGNNVLPMDYTELVKGDYIHSDETSVKADEKNTNSESITLQSREVDAFYEEFESSEHSITATLEDNNFVQSSEEHEDVLEESKIETNINVDVEIPKTEKEEPVKVVIEQEEAQNQSIVPSIMKQSLNIESENAAPVLNVIKTEKPKVQKVSACESASKEKEEKTSLFKFLVMAMRYRSRVKSTKAKKKAR